MGCRIIWQIDSAPSPLTHPALSLALSLARSSALSLARSSALSLLRSTDLIRGIERGRGRHTVADREREEATAIDWKPIECARSISASFPAGVPRKPSLFPSPPSVPSFHVININNVAERERGAGFVGGTVARSIQSLSTSARLCWRKPAHGNQGGFGSGSFASFSLCLLRSHLISANARGSGRTKEGRGHTCVSPLPLALSLASFGKQAEAPIAIRSRDFSLSLFSLLHLCIRRRRHLHPIS